MRRNRIAARFKKRLVVARVRFVGRIVAAHALRAALQVRALVAAVPPAPAMHLITVAALIVIAAVRAVVLRWLTAAGDE